MLSSKFELGCVTLVTFKIILAKKLDLGPAFVLSFQAQQLTRKKREDSVDEVRWKGYLFACDPLPFPCLILE